MFRLSHSLILLAHALTLVSGHRYAVARASTPISSGWYASWVDPAPTISWQKYTAVTYAFACVPSLSNSVSVINLTPRFASHAFVAEAKGTAWAPNPDLKVLLSIGGWTGSIYYSSAVATNASRTAFANAIVDVVTTYKLDGIDFDWEYPGSSPNKTQIGCNQFDPEDSTNFLEFLKTLQSIDVGKDLILTAAVGINPFPDSTGNPSTDVSEFTKVLNRIEIMAYVVWGSWSSTVGPNAPLNDTCEPLPDQQGSAVSSVAAWTMAGFPALNGQQIAVHPVFNKTQSLGPDDSLTWKDPCGKPEISGEFTFSQLISPGGFLAQDGSVAESSYYRFDDCSQTVTQQPYLYDLASHIMISYDDAKSFGAKGEFIRLEGLAGFSIWDLAGDTNDILLDSIQQAMGN
ncbi:glycoside hydrolase family 18 protein [Mycena leptocephala]|nr:glycoside hydrolase family 18 protein [Mycena leptocephala]